MIKSVSLLNYFKYPILLSCLVIIFFGSTLNNKFVFTDEYLVLRNKFLTNYEFIPDLLTKNTVAGSDMVGNLYRPVQGITHFIDVKLFGYQAWGHHLSNVIFQLLLALSLFYLLKRVFNPLASCVAASLFVIHPIQVESVAYISGRGDILGMLFLTYGILWFERNIAVALLFSVLAVFSKESMVLFPVFLIIYLFLKNKTYLLTKDIILRTLPFWTFSFFYVVLRLTYFNFANTLNFYNSQNLLTENFSYRLLTYITTLPKSFLLWIYPYDLHHERSWPIFTDPFILPSFFSILFVIFLVLLLYYFRKRNLAITCGILWFFIATFPTSNLLFILNVTFYDHWFILPGFGFTFILGSIIHKLELTVTSSKIKHILIVFFAVLISYLPLTLAYNDVWKNIKNLNSHILKFENSAIALNNLGMAFANEGDFKSATKYFEKSIATGKVGIQARYNLARVYYENMNYINAKNHLLKAIKIDPLFKPAWVLLEKIFMSEGNHQAAKKLLHKFKTIHNITSN